MRMRIGLVLVLLAMVSASARADLFDPARHMRTSEVRPGMTGYGLSVFRGTKIERFDVEVISVLKNQMGPQQDIVLIRCKGQGLEHSGAIAGMSGSPIYLKDDQGRDRMIGAFALGWEFSKDPIAGVRPIEEMLRVPTDLRPTDAPASARVGTWDTREMLSKSATAPAPLQTDPRNPRDIRPLAVPMSVSGVTPAFVEQIKPWLAGAQTTLLQAGGAGDAPADAKDAKLEPGAAIGVPIVTGDLDMVAVGTVTEVIGNNVFAFGHEFNSEGAVNLPMGVGYIHSVIPSQSVSFKIGSLIRADGAINHDESVAVAGLIGKVPATIPVEITVTTPQRPEAQVYHYQVSRHERFTPMGAVTSIAGAIMGHSKLPAEFTIKYNLKMEFEAGQTVEMKNQTTSLMHAAELIRDLQAPISFAIDNPFRKSYPTRITGNVEVKSTIDATLIRSASTDKTIYKPGESVRLFVTSRPWRGKDQSSSYTLKLPAELADGAYAITVSDAERYSSDETRFAPFKFQVDSISDVFSLIRAMTGDRSDRLYVRLAMPREGVSVGRTALSRLPSGKRSVLTHSPRPEVTTYLESIVQTHDVGTPVIGAVDLQITVARDPDHAARVPQFPVPTVVVPPGAPQPQQPAQPQPEPPTPQG